MLGTRCLDSVDDRLVWDMDVDVEWERTKELLLLGTTREEWTRAFAADMVEKDDTYYIIRAQTRQSTEYPKDPISGYTSARYLSVG